MMLISRMIHAADLTLEEAQRLISNTLYDKKVALEDISARISEAGPCVRSRLIACIQRGVVQWHSQSAQASAAERACSARQRPAVLRAFRCC